MPWGGRARGPKGPRGHSISSCSDRAGSSQKSTPLSEHLIVELCYDQPMAIAGVGESMLEEWGVADSKALTDEWMADFPEDDRRKILNANAERLYDL